MTPQEEAKNPKTSASRLKILSQDPLYAPLVAANPNISFSQACLLLRYPFEILQNPSLSLWLLEDPRCLQVIVQPALSYLWVADKISKKPRLAAFFEENQEFLSYVPTSSMARIESALFWRKNTRKTLREALIALSEQKTFPLAILNETRTIQEILPPLLDWILEDKELPTSTLDWLLREKPCSTETLLQIALHPNASKKVLLLLAGCRDTEVRQVACKHPKAPPVLKKLFRYHNEMASISQGLSQDELCELSQGGPELRAMVASYQETPGHLLEFLEQSVLCRQEGQRPSQISYLFYDGFVLTALAKNPNTPITLLEKLESMCAISVALNPNATEEQLTRLATLAVQRGPTGNPQRSKEPLRKSLWRVQRWWQFDLTFHIALHPKCPPEALVALCYIGNWLLFTCISEHRNAPQELLMSFAKNSNALVRASIASNPKTPRDILLLLAQDVNPLVRRLATARKMPLGPYKEEAWKSLPRDEKRTKNKKNAKRKIKLQLRSIALVGSAPRSYFDTHEKILVRASKEQKIRPKPRERATERGAFFIWVLLRPETHQKSAH